MNAITTAATALVAATAAAIGHTKDPLSLPVGAKTQFLSFTDLDEHPECGETFEISEGFAATDGPYAGSDALLRALLRPGYLNDALAAQGISPDDVVLELVDRAYVNSPADGTPPSTYWVVQRDDVVVGEGGTFKTSEAVLTRII